MPERTAIDHSPLQQQLLPDVQERLQSIAVFDVLDSTNTYLMQADAPPPGMAALAVAEHQTHGRGRHERRWESAAGASLCLSLAYTFDTVPEAPSAVTLLMGVAVANALSDCGVHDIQLKWPNDLVHRDGKLGGLLAESKVKDGAMTVVAGVGLNVALSNDMLRDSSSKWAARAADLRAASGEELDRTHLLASVVNALLPMFREFDAQGVGRRLDEWRRRDWLRGKLVAVKTGARRLEGVASGIDDDGALRVETTAGTRRVIAGSVTVEMNHASSAS